jgi:Carboxypeptidase regulatory-like domain
MSVSREWSRSVSRVASKNERRRATASWPDWMPRDRWPASRLALLAALILFALLTSCSSAQPPRGFSGWTAIAAQPTVQRMNADLGHTALLGDNVIYGSASDMDGNALAGVSIYIQPESSGEVYQTTTGADGAYSYSVPEGAYVISAEYDGTSLDPVDSNSVSVPPSGEVNFQMS